MSYHKPRNTNNNQDLGIYSSSLGIDMDELVRITFLEQSARYLGVYINQDRYIAIDNEQFLKQPN